MGNNEATVSSNLDAHDVARYIVALDAARQEPDVTNLKLQKLLYLAQGTYLAATGRPLFRGTIQAWDHGPVVPNEYHFYKKAGNQIVVYELTADSPASVDIPSDAKEFIDRVWAKYSDLSASRLRNLSHEQLPWRESFGQGRNTEIPLENLRNFFLMDTTPEKFISHPAVVLMSEDDWEDLDATSEARIQAAREKFAA